MIELLIAIIDLTVESIEDNKVIADILTVLPEDFPLTTGGWMELSEDEILYHIPVQGYLKDRVVN